MDRLGKYETKPFTKARRDITLIVREGWLKHSTHALVEFDVTSARKKIKTIHKKTGDKLSFTAWIIKCVAQAITEHKEFNSYRHGKKKIIVFDDVDITIPMELSVNGKERTMAYIIRKANEKTVKEITKEIRLVQREKVDESTELLGKNLNWVERFVLGSPFFIKKLIFRISRNNAKMKKKYMGSAAVTAIGMKGKFPGSVVPMGGSFTLLVVVGGIIKRPGVVDDKIKIREYIQMTITTDHDIIDGGPLTRFVDRFDELIENSFGLIE